MRNAGQAWIPIGGLRIFIFSLQVLIFAAVALGLVVLTLWQFDAWKDRQHTVLAKSQTPIFTGSGADDCGERPRLAIAPEGATLRVRRIRYWKNCATVDVGLPDGRSGYVVLGIGDVSVSPPLRND